MARTLKEPDEPTLRLMRQVLEDSCPPPELAAALAKLLQPRRVRELLAPVNDVRLAIAVAIAELALAAETAQQASALASYLVDVLGCRKVATARLIGTHHRGVAGARTAALDLVARIEGLTQRTVRDRIKGHGCEAGWISRLAQRRAARNG